jgi:hypothetical protein
MQYRKPGLSHVWHSPGFILFAAVVLAVYAGMFCYFAPQTAHHILGRIAWFGFRSMMMLSG